MALPGFWFYRIVSWQPNLFCLSIVVQESELPGILLFLNKYVEITATNPATTKVRSREVMILSIPLLIHIIVNNNPEIIVNRAAVP